MSECTISNVRDIFQILFFITVGTITLLTYLKAKRTLLQPIKTEVFKEQIKVFSDILTFFRGKKEIDLMNEMYFEKLFTVNCISLMDDYAYSHFKIEFDRDERPYNQSECSTSIVSFEYAERFFVLHDVHITDTLQEKISALKTERFKWENYIYGEIKIPDETKNKLKELEKIMDSPLIPKELYSLLEKYETTVNDNISLISDILTKCSQELPDRYPDIKTLEKALLGWIHTKYIDEFAPLEERAKEITDYIRHYFATDNLFN